MVFERTEHEPEEHDPEADFHDPDSDSLTIPRIEPPSIESPAVTEPGAELGGGDVPADVARTFWIVVVVVNAAVLAVSLGVMFVVFWADVTTGGGLFAGGLVLFGLAYRRYRAFRARRSDDGTRDEAVDDPEGAAEPNALTNADSESDTDPEP